MAPHPGTFTSKAIFWETQLGSIVPKPASKSQGNLLIEIFHSTRKETSKLHTVYVKLWKWKETAAAASLL